MIATNEEAGRPTLVVTTPYVAGWQARRRHNNCGCNDTTATEKKKFFSKKNYLLLKEAGRPEVVATDEEAGRPKLVATAPSVAVAAAAMPLAARCRSPRSLPLLAAVPSAGVASATTVSAPVAAAAVPSAGVAAAAAPSTAVSAVAAPSTAVAAAKEDVEQRLEEVANKKENGRPEVGAAKVWRYSGVFCNYVR